MKITNRSDYGDLNVALLRRVVGASATVDVTEDQARRLLPQTANWEPADDEARAVLDDLAADEAKNDGDSAADVAVLEPAHIAAPDPEPAPSAPTPDPVQPEGIEPALIGEPVPPAQSALKAEWEDYAQARGFDPTGKTKQQLIDLTSTPPASDANTEGDGS